MPPEPKPKFDYPYVLDFNDETKAYSLNAKIDMREINFIKGLRLRTSTLSVTTAQLYHKLVNELQRRSITDFTSVDAFESFVLTCRIVDAGEYEQLLADSAELTVLKHGRGGLPNSSASGPLPQSSPSNVGKRTKRVRHVQPPNAAELPDIQGDGGKE